MKNTFICFICLILYGCNLNSDTSYYFGNNSNDTIVIKFYNKTSDSIIHKVAPETVYLFLRVVGISSGPSKMSLSFNDSIFISQNGKQIKFYRDNALKNKIYNMNNWPLTKAINNVYEYTYTINEVDFN